ncbi:phytoene desaturase family protein [Pseudarthrobacter sp. J1763]|uniref:phytoene desaturase family protein n=1 Tax=Pseudarthrobacter sp. J1763 TaxID=3420445 RepID=UPI003D2E380F
MGVKERSTADAAVVGSGPNGLAAAVTLARAGLSVELFEAAEEIGGGTQTREEILPGHFHDVCSAVHPMAVASPFFQAFELSQRVDFFTPDISFATPLDSPAGSGHSALAYRSLDRTVADLGIDDAAYGKLLRPLVEHLDGLLDLSLNQLIRVPKDPSTAAAFAAATLRQGTGFWNVGFREDLAPALLTGAAAHANTQQPSLTSAGAGLMLAALGHAAGWPIPQGGSASIAQAMAQDFRAHGGVIHAGRRVESLSELSHTRAVLLDVAPPAFAKMADGRLDAKYERQLEIFRFGNGACKVDFILNGPVPWQDSRLANAGTVHVGGTRAQMAAAENEIARGKHPAQPYVLISQPSTFDSTRAPEGSHVLWSYCHVPAGSTVDMTEVITAQIERFAPGFRDVVVHSKVRTAAGLQAHNSNYVGGDFGAGLMDLRGLIQRPVISLVPWRTPLAGVYLCSASTPPGPGVTGMPGFHAAKYALKDIFGLEVPNLATNSGSAQPCDQP